MTTIIILSTICILTLITILILLFSLYIFRDHDIVIIIFMLLLGSVGILVGIGTELVKYAKEYDASISRKETQ